MKLSEVISKLENDVDETRIFTSKIDEDEMFAWRMGGFIKIAFKCGGKSLERIKLTREWEEIKQPVSWQEAIQASIDGKKITIEYEGERFEQEDFLKIGCLFLNGNCSNGFDRKMFIEGKWYIGD